MPGKLIVIQGYLASGKSTFARLLCQRLQIPCLVKDDCKMAVCKHVEVEDRQQSSRFSTVAFDAMLWAAACVCGVGGSLILEGNFMPTGRKPVDEMGEIAALARRCGCQVLTFCFTGDTAVLHRRFLAREQTPERGAANRVMEQPDQKTFDGWCRRMDGFFVGGQTVRVDTTDFAAVDLEALAQRAVAFVRG